MFKFPARKPKTPHIDLETVRETLLYIESDCRECPGLERVAARIAETISEIDRLDDRLGSRAESNVVSASFLPVRL